MAYSSINEYCWVLLVVEGWFSQFVQWNLFKAVKFCFILGKQTSEAVFMYQTVYKEHALEKYKRMISSPALKGVKRDRSSNLLQQSSKGLTDETILGISLLEDFSKNIIQRISFKALGMRREEMACYGYKTAMK